MSKFSIKNAVLYKDMTLDMKKGKIFALILVFNLLVGLVAFTFLGGITLGGISSGKVSYAVMPFMLYTLVFLEYGIMIMVVPALTAGVISLEKERQTLEVLLTTRLTPWEIVWGKFWSVINMVGLLVLSSVPFLALVFMYGGINIIHLLLIVAVFMVITMYTAAMGIMWSSILKNTMGSVIMSYITVFFSRTVFLSLGIGVSGVITAIDEAIYRNMLNAAGYSYYYSQTPTGIPQYIIPPEIGIPFFLLAPECTMWDVANRMGFQIGTWSTRGMDFLGEIYPHISSGKWYWYLWTPISVGLFLLLTWGMLKISAFALNPVKKKGKKNKKSKKSKSK